MREVGGLPVTGHERPRGGAGGIEIARRRHQAARREPASRPLRARKIQRHGDPAALAASLAGELNARQRAWSAAASSAKGSKPKPGKGALQPGKSTAQARKSTAGPAQPGQRILAAGIWDGTNFAVNNQVTYRYTSSDAPYLLPDHLPGAYMRLYMGDRVYIEAGLRIFSPQYTRLQQIDSTGDTHQLITPTGGGDDRYRRNAQKTILYRYSIDHTLPGVCGTVPGWGSAVFPVVGWSGGAEHHRKGERRSGPEGSARHAGQASKE